MFKLVKDHLGREVAIPEQPQRIISLCPSITETLIDLGLEDRVVGRTHFCIHPKEQVKNIRAVGGTKKIKYERVDDLQPDLIISEKEENTQEMVDELAQKYPVYVTDVTDLSSSLRMIRDLGIISGAATKAEGLAEQVRQAFAAIRPNAKSQSVLYFIWRKPFMLAGTNTFIHSILDLLGFNNMATSLSGRYPEIKPEQMKELNPEVVLLSSEPYPFEDKHLQEIKDILPEAQIHLVDGEMFTWYGSHMLQSPGYLNALTQAIAAEA